MVGWCRSHGIKVILSFVDNWSFADSKYSVSLRNMFPVSARLTQALHRL